MTITVDDVIATYIKLRDKKQQIDNEAKERTRELTEKMLKLEAWLREQADTQGVTSFKTRHGTAFLTTVDYAHVAEWDSVIDFIKANNAFDMLEKRISKTAVRSYIEMHKSVPAGINYGTKLEVNIRKPTAKVDE
jgi:translation elongation factor EF-Ts